MICFDYEIPPLILYDYNGPRFVFVIVSNPQSLVADWANVCHLSRARAPWGEMLHGCLGFVKPKLLVLRFNIIVIQESKLQLWLKKKVR